jgi:hypothetical protein
MRVVDRIARRFGYVPSGKTEEPPDVEAASPEECMPAHRVGAPEFDFAKAVGRDGALGVGYETDDRVFAAVGRDDWAPMALVCAFLSYRPHELIEAALDGELGVDPGSRAVQDWFLANDGVVAEFCGKLADARVEASPDGFGALEPDEVGYLFELVFKTAFPSMSVRVIEHSSSGAAYLDGGAIRSVRKAVGRALDDLLDDVADWLKLRDGEVDRDGRLVCVPGYQALFSVEEKEAA